MRSKYLLPGSLVLALLSGLASVALPPSPAAARDPAVSSGQRSVAVGEVGTRKPLRSQTDETRPVRTLRKTLPPGGSGEVVASAGSVVGGLPVSLTARDFEAERTQRQADPVPVKKARISVSGRDVATRLGVPGVVLSVYRADGRAEPASARVSVGYKDFADAFGAGYGGRLRLVRLPACALSTPEVPECRATQPLATENAKETVSADVTLAGQGATVLAVTASGSSSAGDFTKTSLSPVYTWSSGAQGGSFSTNYPLKTPPGLGGPEPSLALSYDSGLVDGRTYATSGQASMTGEGWSERLGGGFIERSYRTCNQDGQPSEYQDLCWFSDHNATISLGGKSADLVRDNASGVWKSSADEGWRIEKLTDLAWANGDNNREYWKLTTTDGTQYFFGRHRRYATDPEVTNSVQEVPVYANTPGDPGYGLDEPNCTQTGSLRFCSQAYRWNLDYVLDPHGNTLTYFYEQFRGNYGALNNGWALGYAISARLARIDYGTKAGSEGQSPAPMQVIFTKANRCEGGCSDPEYPETPWDQYCTGILCPGVTAPAFWTPYRLSSVYTQVRKADGIGYTKLDQWDLAHIYPSTGDFISPAGDDTPRDLWLQSLTHTGFDEAGAGQAEPAVIFSGKLLFNRVNWGESISVAPYAHYRIDLISNGTGGQTSVSYSEGECINHYYNQASSFNPTRCFPQYFKPQQAPAGWDWFHKYVVTGVTERDLTGGGPDEVWSYAYSNLSSTDQSLWAHDTAEAGRLDHRSWSVWRGYSDVTMTHGAAGGPQTVTKKQYHRGMSGDAVARLTGNLTDVAWGARRAYLSTPVGAPAVTAALGGDGGRCMEPFGAGTANFTHVHIWDCVPGAPSEIWQYDLNHFALRNQNSNRCLDIPGTANGTFVVIWDCVGETSQMWKWRPDGSLYNEWAGKCLDARGWATGNGTELQIWDCTGEWNQIWRNRNGGHIVSAQSSRCADILGFQSANGSAVGTWVCNGAPNQDWQYQASTQELKSPAFGKCLDALGGATANGTGVGIWDCNGAQSQDWAPQADGSLKNVKANRCLDATHDPVTGEQLIIWDCNGSVTQKWAHLIDDRTPLQGSAREEFTYDGGTLIGSTIHTYQVTQTAVRSKAEPVGPDVYAHMTRETGVLRRAWINTSNAWRWDETQTAYDAYGLPTKTTDLGDLATTADDICSLTSYLTNPGAMLIAFPKETLTTTCGHVTGDGDVLGGKHFYYDNATTDAQPTRGLVTKTTAVSRVAAGTKIWIDAGSAKYDANARIAEASDAIGRKTATAYSPASGGPLTSVKTTNPAGHATTVALDHRGLPKTITDPNGKVTTGTYDRLGRLVKVWKPGHPTNGTPDIEYGYTVQTGAPSSLSTKVLGPNGTQIVGYELYDGRLRTRQTQKTAPDGKRVIADTQYDSRGLTAKTTTFYNAAAPAPTLASFVDTGVDVQTRYTYDGAERQLTDEVWSRDALKWKTINSYGGDRVSVTPPAGGTATTGISDARGRTTVLRLHEGGTPAGPYTSTTFTYDRGGKLTKVADAASNQWLYEYDLLDRRTKTTEPDAGVTLTTYDNAGQMLSTTDARNQVLFFEYDSLGRRTKTRADTATGPVQSEVAYDTVQKGQPTFFTRHDAGGDYVTSVGSYDDGYRPLTITTTAPGFGAGGATLTYTATKTYKPNGAIATSAMPGVGGLPAETLAHGYADSGVPTTLSSAQATYVHSTTYAYDSQVSQYILGAPGKQVRITNIFDDATRRLKEAKTETETATMGTFAEKLAGEYGYKPNGLIDAIAGRTNGARDQVECFSYDHLQQLKEAWTNATWNCAAGPQKTGVDPYWRTWTFDTVGNRLTQTDKNADATTGTGWTYTVGAAGSVKPHQLRKVDATGPLAGTPIRSFAYDAAGNMTSRTTEAGVAQTLDWDKEGRLATVKEGTNPVATYVYDPSGVRLVGTATSGGVTKTMLYLPDGTELEKTSTGGAILGQRYIGGVAVRDAASGLKWAVTDHQGTAVAQIDAAVLAVNRRRSMPYGEARGSQPGWTGTKGYVDGTKDAPTGLTRLGARDYDPPLGRFISRDPVMKFTDTQAWHGYSYSGNSPVSFSDPSGLHRPKEPNDPPPAPTPTPCHGGNQSAACRPEPQDPDSEPDPQPDPLELIKELLQPDPELGPDPEADDYDDRPKRPSDEAILRADPGAVAYCQFHPDVCIRVLSRAIDAYRTAAENYQQMEYETSRRFEDTGCGCRTNGRGSAFLADLNGPLIVMQDFLFRLQRIRAERYQ